MSLPKIQTPTHSATLPSNGQKVVYRPFTVREEKILLIAQQSDSNDDQIRAIKQVLSNCIVEPEELNVDKLASFDVEYLFLKLRGKSVGEEIEVNVSPQNRDDLPPQKVNINIDDIEPIRDPNHTNVIDLENNIKLIMKYPSLEMVNNAEDFEDDPTKIFARTVDSIYFGEEVYEAKDYNEDELVEFFDQMTNNQMEKLRQFFETLPRIEKSITYTHTFDNGETYTEEVKLRGLMSFLS